MCKFAFQHPHCTAVGHIYPLDRRMLSTDVSVFQLRTTKSPDFPLSRSTRTVLLNIATNTPLLVFVFCCFSAGQGVHSDKKGMVVKLNCTVHQSISGLLSAHAFADCKKFLHKASLPSPSSGSLAWKCQPLAPPPITPGPCLGRSPVNLKLLNLF